MRTVNGLFAAVPPAPADARLAAALAEAGTLAVNVNTEKARSELLVAPVLTEVWRVGRGRVAWYSGVPLVADRAADLVGVCDFLLGRPPQLDYVTAPVLAVVEAKRENIMGGIGQWAATMVGIQRFNAARKAPVEVVYGCVTNGVSWKFLRLTGVDLDLDAREYIVHPPDEVLGVLLHVVGLNPI